MYIKLGSTSINRQNAIVDEKYIILAEVIDSGLSFERPTVVTSVSELEALFSNSFSDYNYLSGLIHQGAGLYLCGPISPKISPSVLDSDEYIDYTKFEVIEDIYEEFSPSIDYVKFFEEWKTTNQILPVLKDTGEVSYYILKDHTWVNVTKVSEKEWQVSGTLDTVDYSLFKGELVRSESLEKFKKLKETEEVILKFNSVQWVWTGPGFGFIKESLLPQNQSTVSNSESLDNRSTLLIPIDSTLSPIHPEYKVGKGLCNNSFPEIPKINLKEKIGRNIVVRLKENSEISLNSKGVYELGFKVGENYVSITTSLSLNTKIYPEALTKLITLSTENSGGLLTSLEKKLEELEDSAITTFWDGKDLILISRDILNLYNTFPNIEVTSGEEDLVQSIYYNSLETKDGIHIWSKTIGGTGDNDPNGKIKVRIEPGEYEGEYWVEISRYSYVENFKGFITNSVGIERLDRKIEKNSRLIHFKLQGNISELIPGTYYLSQGKNLTSSESGEDIRNALKIMFDQDTSNIPVDFLLIPSLKSILQSDRDTSHLEEFSDLLKYSYRGNFQVLIQNTDSKYKYQIASSIEEVNMNNTPNTVYYLSDISEIRKYFYEGNILWIKSELPEELSYNSEKNYLISEKLGNDGKTVVTEDIRSVIFTDQSNSSEVSVKYLDKSLSQEGASIVLKVQNHSSTTSEIHVKKYNKSANTGAEKILWKKSIKVYPGNSIGLLIKDKNVIEVPLSDSYYFSDSNGKLSNIVSPGILKEAYCGGDFVHNYTGNKDERFIYFYRPIQNLTGGYSMPAYSIFLQGILTGNYSGKSNRILYNNFSENPYETSKEEQILERYRSNYLVFDGKRYYYKKYFEHPERNTSVFLRFILGKVTRELEKLKPQLVGLRGSIIQTLIEESLKKIRDSFEIVASLRITNYELDLSENKLDLELETSVNNLVDKNVRLNITLNLK